MNLASFLVNLASWDLFQIEVNLQKIHFPDMTTLTTGDNIFELSQNGLIPSIFSTTPKMSMKFTDLWDCKLPSNLC